MIRLMTKIRTNNKSAATGSNGHEEGHYEENKVYSCHNPHKDKMTRIFPFWWYNTLCFVLFVHYTIRQCQMKVVTVNFFI